MNGTKKLLWQRKMSDRWRKEYEEAFCKLVGAEGARAFTRGRQALVILLKTFGVGRGDKVGVCGFTCLSVVEAVKVCGATPVYLDVDEHLCINHQDVLRQLPGSLKVVILQHTFGIPGRLEKLISACREINAIIVEDCAQALGCSWNDTPLGKFGEAAIYSFQWGKPYTTGRGGMLTVNSFDLLCEVDKQIGRIAQPMLFKHDLILACQRAGFSKLSGSKFEYMTRLFYCKLREKGLIKGTLKLDSDFSLSPGYVRLSGSFMPRAGLSQLKKWPELQRLRRKNTDLIRERFLEAGLPLWPVPTEAEVTMLRYPILVPRKDEILEKARRAMLDIAGWYCTPVHPIQNDELTKVDYQLGSCSKAEEMIRRLVHIPTGLALNRRSLEAMTRIIQESFGNANE